MKIIRIITATLILAAAVAAQDNEKPRVFVTDSQSWEISGGGGGSRSGFGSAGSGGARPQTAEIIKTFNERCPDCVITTKKERADYVVILEHEGGKSVTSKDNKFALINKDGDVIKSGSTRILGNAVKDVCLVIQQDWKSRQSSEKPEEKSNNKDN
jgi:hypothetical protein